MGLIVVDPGFSTTVQDAGRSGYREWGVSPGGAFDRGAAGLANALAGNDGHCAVLELTLIGGTYQAEGSLALALAGAPMEARVVAVDQSQRDLMLPSSFTLLDGERLVLGRTVEGARTYLAVRAGWQTRLCLGSRSSEECLRAGDVLPAERGSIPTRRLGPSSWIVPTAEPLRTIGGPDVVTAGMDSGSAPFWAGRDYRVGSRSNRMGLRLEGEPVHIVATPERLSAPVAAGAVQVAGGQLIVLGVACGTMGGYPHVAHVISADLDRLGQLRPGDRIGFRRVTLDEARATDLAMRRDRRERFHRIATAAQDV